MQAINLMGSSGLQASAIFAGVDAGGSKCRTRLVDHNGTVLAEGTAGPANAHTDPDGAWASIISSIESALAEASLPRTDVARLYVGIGVAGLDRLRPRPPGTWLLERFGKFRVDSDAYAAHLGAHGGADGAVLIVGTGSVGLAVVRGRRTAIGGYGAEISDEGSGAWIGREAARRAMWSYDGRSAASGLVDVVGRAIGGIGAISAWARDAAPSDYARLAPEVITLAESSDAAACEIVDAATMHLRRMICRLADIGADRLCIVGGLAQMFAHRIEPVPITLVPPLADPLDGAIRMIKAEAYTA